MTGYVLHRHIFVDMPIRFADGSFRNVAFLLDSGFSGELAMPEQDVAILQLPFADNTEADLANGTQVTLSIQKGFVLWHNKKQEVDVIVTGDRPLIGLGLLEGTALYAEFISKGKVTLHEIARTEA